MALNAYLTLKGKRQGDISGSVTKKGRENSILVYSFSNEVLVPRDPASGMATGRRQHKPLMILKEIDKSTPLLWNALATNESITAWELKFWAPSNTGQAEKQIYSIRLTNANIVSIRDFMPDNQDPERAKLPLQEEIFFTYQKIEWLWTDGGISAQDDWQSPGV
ncbi:Hcp family type VI secretion system effector [soil metagenome]